MPVATDHNLVNGFLIKYHIGRPVRILLRIQSVSPDGNMVQGIATDDLLINLRMRQPLTNPIFGWTEVFGVPTNVVTINCREIINFPNGEYLGQLDKDKHNFLVMALQFMKNFNEYFRR